MPFPVAHALLGASIVVAGGQNPINLNRAGIARVALGAFLATVPDLDFIGIWFFHLNKSWHRGFSHSLLAAIVLGSLIALWVRKGSRTRWFILYASAIASHGLLDALLSIKSGASLLWPLTSNRIAAGLIEYPDSVEVRYSASLDLLTIKNGIQLLRFSAIEFAVMGALLILIFFVKSRFESRVP